jgi:hypothetical protein
MAFCWDDRGRMWIAENRTPSRPIPEPPSGGPVAANLKSNFLPATLLLWFTEGGAPPAFSVILTEPDPWGYTLGYDLSPLATPYRM